MVGSKEKCKMNDSYVATKMPEKYDSFDRNSINYFRIPIMGSDNKDESYKSCHCPTRLELRIRFQQDLPLPGMHAHGLPSAPPSIPEDVKNLRKYSSNENP